MYNRENIYTKKTIYMMYIICENLVSAIGINFGVSQFKSTLITLMGEFIKGKYNFGQEDVVVLLAMMLLLCCGTGGSWSVMGGGEGLIAKDLEVGVADEGGR